MELAKHHSDNSWRRKSYRKCYLWILMVLGITVATGLLLTKVGLLSSQDLLHFPGEKASYSKPAVTSQPADIKVYEDTDLDDDDDKGDPLIEAIEEPPNDADQQNSITKVVVAAVRKGEQGQLAWVPKLLPDWKAARYTYDGPDKLFLFNEPENQSVTKNKGREANVYLTYIITHYDNLPDYMVFIHGKRYQSHNDDPMYDTLPSIRDLRLDYVAENGYTPLRCAWHEGCPGPDFKPLLGHNDGFWEVRGLYAKTFKTFFPNATIPKKVAAPCCAQFAVSKSDVLKIPLRRWKLFRRYIYNAHFAFEAVESMKLGLVLEYMWHIIFGKPAMFCGQPAKECYCKKFGLCNLKCPKKESCKGRVWPRPAMQLPKGWPNKSQGINGWPVEGWWNQIH